MPIVVFGASGNIGSNIRKEALSRGHRVTAVTHSADLEPAEHLTALKADIADPEEVARIVVDHDAVISAYSPGLRRHSAEDAAVLIEKAHASLFEGVKRAGVRRILIVGGLGAFRQVPASTSSTAISTPRTTGPHAAQPRNPAQPQARRARP
ncbi:NAD(P)-dependent oxidoreductase [Sinorhizobium meliloti]|uniref:NAD(P)-dependent oxidoreductase n=1 Tax=Rhizobium meliloti TaxID=382 RepID=UPI001F32BC7C|nr:NAD(P)H-binding protein [Sinorhizobium meliloti]